LIHKEEANKSRLMRHARVRKKVSGTPERPRLNVFRSGQNIYAQIVDDSTGNTLVAASTLDKELKGQFTNGGNAAAAILVGTLVAKRAQEKGLKQVVFDRGGYI
jgi:large subunit ribosomal protein L18